MADNVENRLPFLVQDLRHIQSAAHVLAECLSRFGDEPAADEGRQMERLHGVAFLMELVSQHVNQVQETLKNEIASR